MRVITFGQDGLARGTTVGHGIEDEAEAKRVFGDTAILVDESVQLDVFTQTFDRATGQVRPLTAQELEARVAQMPPPAPPVLYTQEQMDAAIRAAAQEAAAAAVAAMRESPPPA